MQKILKKSGWLILGFNLLTLTQHAHADSPINIRFEGEVTQSVCAIQGGDGKSINVPLNKISSDKFTQIQAETPETTKFVDIVLTGCPAKNVHFTFRGTEDSAGSGRLKIDEGSGMAKGVAVAPKIKISNRESSLAMPKATTETLPKEADGTIKVSIGGSLVRTTSAIPEPGIVRASMTLDFDYL